MERWFCPFVREFIQYLIISIVTIERQVQVVLLKNNTEIFAEKQKQQMCLGTVYALLIRAKIAEISLQAQPYCRESCQIRKNKSRRQADSLQKQCPKATNQTTPNLDLDLRLH